MKKAFSLVSIVLLAVPLAPAQSPFDKTPLDTSVQRALEFLANTQNKSDGSWTAGRTGKNVAITSLAVMAFLSAGHVPGDGKYGSNIEMGIRWVLSMQQPNGVLANDAGHEMYHHGIATLMLAEVCGMVDKELSKEVRRGVEKAITVILKAQRTDKVHGGGWRYRVEHVAGSDISVSGWQVMSLRAARNLGCDISGDVIEKAVDFIKRCQDGKTGGFRYMPFANVTTPCTGTSVLALELCGKDEHKSSPVMKGAAFLVRNENLPRWNSGHFFYGIYYGAQATFQVGGNFWSTYRSRLHQVLLKNQNSNGAWLGGGYDSIYGPNYCTAMAILALTVEYRFLPIYQRGEEPSDRINP